MSLNEEVDLLRKIPLFAKIDPSKLKLLAFTSERLNYADDQILFHQGDTGDAAYIIINGFASVLIDTPGGQVEVAQLGKGDVVGEIAILCDVPRTATVQAKESLVTLKISKDTFFKLVNDVPQIAVEIMRELASRLESTNTKLREALSGGTV
ncbi:MAG: cyclic nucleotide-binding domain-containing protein [Rhodospirillaceae bacterium]|nr:cyclic nucleotide-binding domain-containing protein [Rhodospirillaceae bacterium]MBT6138884.1 cyclic nucleotide-binding domain-containing protein [Rhodospirillaceae bacterium]